MPSTARPEAGPPGLHPAPPPQLGSIELPLETTARNWFRVHPTGREPLFFGRTGRNRFDAPNDEFGSLYVGQDEHCVFIETFGRRSSEVDYVTADALQARAIARIEPKRSLRLVDLTGSGLARLRADARLCTGSIVISKRWALALFQHPDRADGIYYRSRHDPDRFCAAIFDRALGALAASPLGNLADPTNRSLLANILNTYDFGLIDA